MSQEGDTKRLLKIRDGYKYEDGFCNCDRCVLLRALDTRDATLASANAELDAAHAEIATLKADVTYFADRMAHYVGELARLRSTAPSDDLRAEKRQSITCPVLDNCKSLRGTDPVFCECSGYDPETSGSWTDQTEAWIKAEAAPPSASDVAQARGFVETWHLPQRVTNNLAHLIDAARQAGVHAGREWLAQYLQNAIDDQGIEITKDLVQAIVDDVRRIAPDTEK